MANVYIGIDKY